MKKNIKSNSTKRTLVSTKRVHGSFRRKHRNFEFVFFCLNKPSRDHPRIVVLAAYSRNENFRTNMCVTSGWRGRPCWNLVDTLLTIHGCEKRQRGHPGGKSEPHNFASRGHTLLRHVMTALGQISAKSAIACGIMARQNKGSSRWLVMGGLWWIFGLLLRAGQPNRVVRWEKM